MIVVGRRTTTAVILAAGALAFGACGESETSGGALPPASPATTVPPTTATPSTEPTPTTAPVPTTEPTPTTAHGTVYDPSAEIRHDLMEVRPDVTTAGSTVELAFPEGTTRGVAFTLDERIGEDEWATRYLLTASYSDVEPAWSPAGEPFETVDLGVGGPGPDIVTIPDTAPAGPYRICTANAGENFCVPVAVASPAGDAGVVPIVGVHDGVAFYPACGNETLRHEAVTWYPLAHLDGFDDEYQAIYDDFVAVEREPSPVAGWRGFGASRVVEPGPGDDVGTLVVWEDGFARWVSDSGDLDTWLTDREITYDWVC